MYLNENTSIVLDARRRMTLQQGQVYVEVAPRDEASSGEERGPATFLVKTPHRDISALGTKFSVTAATEATGVVVVQGKVHVEDVEKPLVAGQQLLAKSAAGQAVAPLVSAAPRASHTLSWTQELMAAAESPLVPASHHAGGSLVVVDPQGQETRLSLRKYHVDVHIEDGFARTTIDQTYFNHLTSRQEGTFHFPLPG
ncbi:MAG TPA: FecR domain-containing protein, partial [Pirellulales bacterium]|nr:FecR domain-containing protein [Pirellulales bacterium]